MVERMAWRNEQHDGDECAYHTPPMMPARHLTIQPASYSVGLELAQVDAMVVRREHKNEFPRSRAA
jgi:hypothetical protein